MIKNIGAYLDHMQAYLVGKTELNTLFGGRIYAGRPIIIPTGKYLYFQLVNNLPKISNDRNGTIKKMAVFEFYIVGNDKNLPDVEIYEALDILSNNIVTIGEDDDTIALGTLNMASIDEGVQSGILRETDENPYLIAQYDIIYQSRY